MAGFDVVHKLYIYEIKKKKIFFFFFFLIYDLATRRLKLFIRSHQGQAFHA